MNTKIIEKIKKLLEMTEANGASENEAMVAALKAQKLMAECNIDLIDIQDEHKPTDEISEEFVDISDNSHQVSKWKGRLANIIAQNFRCKVYLHGNKAVVFYGYKTDAKIAGDVFKFLFKTGGKLANKYYNLCRKEGKSTRGVLNAYLVGYCQGIADVLEKQCVALMIVTPAEVEDGWKEKSKGFGTKSNALRISGDQRAFEYGRNEGRSVANARSIEG